jgi:hypothetical protein
MKNVFAMTLLLSACASPRPEPTAPVSAPSGRMREAPPLHPVDAKVSACSPQAGVVVLNQGRDQGVMVGMKFTIYRGSDFVATAVVQEVTREWASAVIDLKYLEPRVGDDASNHLLTRIR